MTGEFGIHALTLCMESDDGCGDNHEGRQNGRAGNCLSVGMNQRLSPQCLPRQQQHEPQVSRPRGKDKTQPMDFSEVRKRLAASRDPPPQKRQDLHRVDPPKVCRSQVTAD